MEKKQIQDFYDDYTGKQTNTGVNLRHRTILQRLKKSGLKPHHRVLEIGCGIGTVTRLLSSYLKSGFVTGVDISPKSIELARKHFAGKKNTSFEVSDMSDFSAEKKFDFVVMPDVLEHIPVEQHRNLFKVIRNNINIDATIAINLPSPYALDWMRVNKPELLQIIDQSIYSDILVSNIYPNDLYLYSLESYCLYTTEPDYQWIVIKPNKPYSYQKKTYVQNASATLRSKLGV